MTSDLYIISSLSCLPIWIAKTIEVVGSDVCDVSLGQQTQSKKQHSSVSLMTRVLEIYGPITYLYVKGKPEWE